MAQRLTRPPCCHDCPTASADNSAAAAPACHIADGGADDAGGAGVAAPTEATEDAVGDGSGCTGVGDGGCAAVVGTGDDDATGSAAGTAAAAATATTVTGGSDGTIVTVSDLVNRIIMSYALCKHGPQCSVKKCGFAHSIQELVPQKWQCMRQEYSGSKAGAAGADVLLRQILRGTILPSLRVCSQCG